MNKVFIFTIILALGIVGFSGCNAGENSNEEAENPMELLMGSAPEGTAAVLINQPTEDQRKEFSPSELLVLEESMESFLLIPSETIEEITIWEIEFDGSEFVRGGAVYKNYDPHEEYILHLVTMRPEGGPHYELSLLSDEGEATYYIAYDGKDGNPNIEYVKYK
ncbi:hypothetical protein MASR2M70_16000 [Bacillota bacterium]